MKQGGSAKGVYPGADAILDRPGRSGGTLLDRLFQRLSASPFKAKSKAPRDVACAAQKFELVDLPFVADSLIALLAPDTAEYRRVKSDIEELGGTVMIIPQRTLPETWLRNYASRLTCCIVGHNFADADEAVDYCLHLRFVAPELVIILALAGVARNDFSSERMPICEATLRRPISRVPLLLGLKAACDNRLNHESNGSHGGSAAAEMPSPLEDLFWRERR